MIAGKKNAPAANRSAEKNRDGQEYTPQRVSASACHRVLCAERFAQRLLVPFVCARRSKLSLDPLGRDGKREFLCGACADTMQNKEQR
jgi:hypothetical protein